MRFAHWCRQSYLLQNRYCDCAPNPYNCQETSIRNYLFALSTLSVKQSVGYGEKENKTDTKKASTAFVG